MADHFLGILKKISLNTFTIAKIYQKISCYTVCKFIITSLRKQGMTLLYV